MSEVDGLLKGLGMDAGDTEVAACFNEMNADGGSEIDFSEFSSWWLQPSARLSFC